MLLDEARLAARIRHPNVVPTLDVVAESGEVFLVMDYVQGESLSHLARTSAERGVRIAPAIAVSIVAGALRGLHAAHEARDERGICLELVHRDVSPHNILVGVDGLARLIDFGVAKAAGRANETRPGYLKGKLAYMPPEQLSNGRLTRQADIYSASVVLWETLVGRRLFESDTEIGLLASVLGSDVRPPGDFVPDIPEELNKIVLRGLSRHPSARFATAREMAVALEAAGAASIAEVADWVEAIASSSLAVRAEKIARVETTSPTPSGPKSLPELANEGERPSGSSDPFGGAATSGGATEFSVTTAVVAPAGRRRRTALFVAAAAALVVGGLGLVVVMVKPSPTPIVPPLASPRSPLPSSTEQGPEGEASPSPSMAPSLPSGTALAEPTTSTGAPTNRARVPEPTKRAPAKPTKPVNDNPFKGLPIDRGP
jgi:serine/threonine-protein kinase